MELHTFLGWTSEVFVVLDALNIAPNVDPFGSDSFDLPSFIATRDGLNYIQDELHRFNNKWKTQLRLFSSGSDFLLISTAYDNLILGDPGHDPVHVCSIDVATITQDLKKFKTVLRKTGLTAPYPKIKIITDLTTWYELIQDQDMSHEETDSSGKILSPDV